MLVLELLVLSFISGVSGRLGGAKGYNTLFRDVGCSLLAVVAMSLFIPLHLTHWWVYLIVFGLHWAAFSTYWDWLFGYDNMWFSGFVAGIAMMPACVIVHWIWWVLLIRAVVLAIIWGLLNTQLPDKVLVWRRDVAEEFLRYAVVV